jgi:hypothetical protein
VIVTLLVGRGAARASPPPPDWALWRTADHIKACTHSVRRCQHIGEPTKVDTPTCAQEIAEECEQITLRNLVRSFV